MPKAFGSTALEAQSEEALQSEPFIAETCRTSIFDWVLPELHRKKDAQSQSV
jgi:hypothetical protein